MYQDEHAKRRQKIITGFLVTFAVVIVAVVVSTLSSKSSRGTNAFSTSGIAGGGAATTRSSVASTATYKDGTYSASASYATPGGTEDIGVTITLQSNTVTDANLDQSANNHDSREYQNMFDDAYKSYVVGKPLNSIGISRVSGASLTTEGFNTALEQIKHQAQQP